MKSIRLYYFGVWQSVCVQVSHQWVTVSYEHYLLATGENGIHTDSQLYQLHQPNRTVCWMCSSPLSDVTSADQLVPVCCDDRPIRNTNCNNTGEGRCDTRFRWTIRPFGASLETRPVTILNAVGTPPYYFTDCGLSGSICPFSEMSTTFGQGQTGFLGVAANPLPVIPKTTLWTVS